MDLECCSECKRIYDQSVWRESLAAVICSRYITDNVYYIGACFPCIRHNIGSCVPSTRSRHVMASSASLLLLPE